VTLTLTTLGIVFERRGDGRTLAALGKMGTWIGTRISTLALFLAFAVGATLMEKKATTGVACSGSTRACRRADRLLRRVGVRPRARALRHGRQAELLTIGRSAADQASFSAR
jgi:hypothetical protein